MNRVPALVQFSVQRPVTVILLCVLVTAAALIPVSRLDVEADAESLILQESEPEDLTYSAGYDRLTVLARGERLYTIEGLRQFSGILDTIGRELGAAETISPFSMITLETSGSRIKPVTMAQGGNPPETEQELADFIRHLDADPFANGLIRSQDGSGLTALFLIPSPESYPDADRTVRQIIQKQGEGLDITVTGSIPFSAETERYLTQGAPKLLGAVLATILLCYYLSFRSLRAMLYPAVLVVTGTLWSLGFTGLMGWKISVVSIVSPPLVLTLGSSCSIHILNEYFQSRCTPALAVSRISGTIVMASSTTAAALLCLLSASMPQTRQFALSTVVGVVSTALLSLTLLPAMMTLGPPRHRAHGRLISGLERLGPFLVRQRRGVVVFLILLTSVFVFLSPRAQFNTSPVSYFPSDSAVVRELGVFSREAGGLDEISIELEAPEGKSNYFIQPEILNAVHQMETRLRTNPDISHLLSLPSWIAFASQSTGQNGFANPGLNLLIARMALLALPQDSNDDFSKITLRLRIYNSREQRSIDEQDTVRIKNTLEQILEQDLPSGVSWSLNSLSLDFLTLSETMRRDFLVSTLMAMLLTALICSLAFRSPGYGLLALLPLAAGMALTFILMIVFKIPLDMTTVMVSCVAIGVGVDDSVHFLLRCRKETRSHPDKPAAAAGQTLRHTGRSILLTTLSIVPGLVWFGFAEFQPVKFFGLLIVLTLSAACAATLFLLPPLAVLSGNKKEKKPVENQ